MNPRTYSASKEYGLEHLNWVCGLIHVVGGRMVCGVRASEGDGGIILLWRKWNDRRRT